MDRTKATYVFAPAQYEEIKNRMLNWSKQFSILVFLDSNGYRQRYGRYECLLAAGRANIINIPAGLDGVRQYHNEHNDWLFGHIAYDYKNNIEYKLESNHSENIGFDDIYFFCPETVCYVLTGGNELVIETIHQPDIIYAEIMNTDVVNEYTLPQVQFVNRTGKDRYINTVEQLREHIKDGDCYEINYCTEGFAESVILDSMKVFTAINRFSKAPFAAYYRNEDKYLMCSSPERYLYKDGSKIVSQPIKGTTRRGSNPDEDNNAKISLLSSIKDRAENVMITDLVRNDLARSCEVGSVQVDELFGIYTFPQVHQMVSTISAKLAENCHFTDTIKYSFPMGSMTGAPKVKVMELIEKYEDARRGLFSGSVGYITPAGDFDFNVVIRSLFYNQTTQYLSYQAGGAITYDSTAEGEWEEMRLKAWALEQVFT